MAAEVTVDITVRPATAAATAGIAVGVLTARPVPVVIPPGAAATPPVEAVAIPVAEVITRLCLQGVTEVKITGRPRPS
jgi:hypothetical protein